MSDRSMPLATEVVARVTGALEPLRDPVKAGPMRAYLRDQFEFLGIPKPARDPAVRAALAGLDRPTADDLEAVARLSWARPEREYRYVGLQYLRRHVQVLPASFIDTARFLLTTDPWWDTVDEIAQNIVGPLVLAHPELVEAMDAWIDDDDLWLARTAIIHQDRFKAATDPERLFRYCARRAPDTELFIRKAIGWALREYSKTDEPAVRAFVLAHDADLSGLSKREALKWLARRDTRAATPSVG